MHSISLRFSLSKSNFRSPPQIHKHGQLRHSRFDKIPVLIPQAFCLSTSQRHAPLVFCPILCTLCRTAASALSQRRARILPRISNASKFCFVLLYSFLLVRKKYNILRFSCQLHQDNSWYPPISSDTFSAFRTGISPIFPHFDCDM